MSTMTKDSIAVRRLRTMGIALGAAFVVGVIVWVIVAFLKAEGFSLF